MDKFQNKYRIPSARLASWNYNSPGLYFITICTKDRNHFFGEIKNDQMFLNEIGKIADKFWAEIPIHFQNVLLGEFEIMPNHTHGIIIMEENNECLIVETGHALSPEIEYGLIGEEPGHAQPSEINDGLIGAETGHALSPDNINDGDIVETRHALSPDNINDRDILETRHALSLQSQQPEKLKQPHFRFRNQGKNTVSAMVGSFKSAVTNKARIINPDFGWQSRFHDHIIQNHEEYLRISNYIKTNPANWEKDKFFK